MKILISNDGYHAHYFQRLGLARAFAAAGHDTFMWQMGEKNVNDMFDKLGEINLFIGQTYNVNRSLFNQIKDRPEMFVVMKGSDFGEIQAEIDLTQCPVLVITEEEKRNISALKEETGKPDYVDIHYPSEFIERTHGYWRTLGIEPKSNMNAADVFDYTNGKFNPHFASDLAFIGGKWQYKAKTIDPWLLPLCSPAERYNVKIFSNQSWGVSQYCGNIETKDVKDVFASAKICPNISELHSQLYGYDIIERPFKILSNRCLCISDYVSGMEEVFGDGLVMAKTPEEFKEKIDFFLKEENKELRDKIAKKGYDKVIASETYFHRAASIFTNLNLPAEAANVLKSYEVVKEKLSL